jgi:hypothetical protein
VLAQSPHATRAREALGCSPRPGPVRGRSGREDPGWEASDEEVKKSTARFDTLKARDVLEPLDSVLGYRGFSVDGFRSYDRIRAWKGPVGATRDGKIYRWDDNDRTLEMFLPETSAADLSDREYDMAAEVRPRDWTNGGPPAHGAWASANRRPATARRLKFGVRTRVAP